MALTPVKGKWSQQLLTGETTSFTIETTALKNVQAVYNPVFRFYNIGDENATLVITSTLDLGTDTDDPLNSGSFTETVLDTVVPAETTQDYAFGGIQLDNDEDVTVTHTVTITNSGLATQVFHSILFGSSDVQFGSANIIIRNS